MGWDVSREMVDELLAAKVPGISTRLQALAVFQHCSINEWSLFDFFERCSVDGMMLLNKPTIVEYPVEESLPAVAAVVPAAVDAAVCWKHEGWRDMTISADRLECLRKHIAEVRSAGVVGEKLQSLEEMERKLARVVEPVPTLGMVAEDESDENLDEYSADPMGEPDDDANDDSLDQVARVESSMDAESDEIAAVLSNPQAAVQSDVATSRKDSQGRVLVSAEMLDQIFAAGARVGFTKEVLKEMAIERFKLRVIEDLPEAVAVKFLSNLKQRAAAV